MRKHVSAVLTQSNFTKLFVLILFALTMAQKALAVQSKEEDQTNPLFRSIYEYLQDKDIDCEVTFAAPNFKTTYLKENLLAMLEYNKRLFTYHVESSHIILRLDWKNPWVTPSTEYTRILKFHMPDENTISSVSLMQDSIFFEERNVGTLANPNYQYIGQYEKQWATTCEVR